MEKLILTFVGEDSWNRPVYKDEEGNLFKDTNLGNGNLALCTVYGGFEGEPDTPIEYIKKYQDIKIEILGKDELLHKIKDLIEDENITKSETVDKIAKLLKL